MKGKGEKQPLLGQMDLTSPINNNNNEKVGICTLSSVAGTGMYGTCPLPFWHLDV